MLRNRRSFLLVLLTCLAALCVCGFSCQGAYQIPPDIQKIMDKAASGKPLTAAEQKRLEDWGKKMQDPGKVPVPGGYDQVGMQMVLGQGIPFRVTVSGEYTVGGGEERVTFDMHTTGELFSKVDGNGDWLANLKQGGPNSSFFQFMHNREPDMRPKKGGTGSYSYLRKTQDETEQIDMTYDEVYFNAFLFTTGTDKLFGSGPIVGVGKGTRKYKGFGQNVTEPYKGEGLWPVKVPLSQMSTIDWKPGKPLPTQNLPSSASYKALAAAVTGKTQSGVTWDEQLNFKTLDGKQVRGHVTTNIVLRADDKPELVVDLQGYDDWRPKGGLDEGQEGNSIKVVAELVNPDGSPLTQLQKADKVTFKLSATSQEPGVCMNWPEQADTNRPYDLQFDPAKNPDLEVSADHQVATTTTGNLAKADILLSSYDWGAWSSLEVTAETKFGKITGVLKADRSIKSIRLPKREKGQHVAEAWSKAKGVPKEDEETDNENNPVGDRIHGGDGYTIYEEYRGWMENGKHIDGDPKRKDLMILNDLDNKRRGWDGVDLFTAVSGLATHAMFKKEEFGERIFVKDDYERNKVMNRYVGIGAHLEDQHGIVLTNIIGSGAYAVAKWKVTGKMGTPKRYIAVEIPRGFNPAPSNWKQNTVGTAKILTDVYASLVAHELLHCVNVYHHGDTDWRFAKVYATKINQNKWGIQVDLYDPDTGASEGSHVVNLFEDTVPPKPIYTNDPRWKTWGQLRMYIADSEGQHSGDEDCIMRYSVANAYLRGNNVYYMNHPHGTLNELAGITLCTSPVGTGVNAPGNKPWPPYGNASQGRGACKNQICVNDRFH